MRDEKEKTVETIKTLEKIKEPVCHSGEAEEELLEHDLEEVAGASCAWTKSKVE